MYGPYATALCFIIEVAHSKVKDSEVPDLVTYRGMNIDKEVFEREYGSGVT